MAISTPLAHSVSQRQGKFFSFWYEKSMKKISERDDGARSCMLVRLVLARPQYGETREQ
jgi:hypothetical protein